MAGKDTEDMGIRDYRKRSLWMRLERHFVSCLMLAGLLVLSSSAHSAPKTLLVLGDSLSAEYGLQRGTGWVALLNKQLATDRIAVKMINASITGDTTSGGKSRLPALLKQYHPSIVVIELGGNDGLRGLPLKTIEANLRAMIAAAKNAKAKVLLLGIQLPPNYGRQYAAQFSDMYGKVARDTRSALVPFMLEGFGDQPRLFQADGIHPTVDAQAMIMANVLPHLRPLLK